MTESLSVYWGLLLNDVLPLEMALNWCSHSCHYCSDIDTPIMLNNLRTIPAGEVKVGDKLFGWDRSEEKTMRAIGKNGYSLVAAREWQSTTVTHVVHRKAKVIRAHLSNGESLVCTPDHHWFTGRTGKFEYQPLAGRNKPDLLRLGLPLLPQQSFNHDYMVGYVKGFAEGDGAWMPQKTWRIASKDPEPLARIASFLLLLNLGHFDARPYPDGAQQLYFPVESPVNEMINGLDIESLEYWRGWLGGIYDAEGNTPARLSRSAPEALRINQYRSVNPLTYDRIQRALRLFGFGYVQEPTALRVVGGRIESAKFTQLVQPCIERKINPLFGSTMKGCYDKFDVVMIEDWGEADVASFETSTHNYVSAGCLSRNCFANLNSPTRKANVPQIMGLLNGYKDKTSFSSHLLKEGYPIKCSNHVDFFAKSNEQIAMPIMEAMTDLDIPFSIATKGGDRFYDALKFIKPQAMYWSIATLNDDIVRRTEEGAPPISKRLDMIAAARAKGHRINVGINPCVKEWIDDPLKICKILKSVGVEGVWIQTIHLSNNQIANMTDRGKASLGESVISVARKAHKSQENIDIYIRTRDAAMECGLEIYDIGQSDRSNYFKPFQEVYKKTYPIKQDFVNYCWDVGKIPHVTPIYWNEYRDFFVPKFPQGVFALRNHLGASQYAHFWKDWDTIIPKYMSYETLLQYTWEIREIGSSPANVNCFSRAVVIDAQGKAKEVLDNNGMPILLFTPDQTISNRYAYAEWLEPDSSLPFESVTPLVDRVMYDKLKASQISYL